MPPLSVDHNQIIIRNGHYLLANRGSEYSEGNVKEALRKFREETAPGPMGNSGTQPYLNLVYQEHHHPSPVSWESGRRYMTRAGFRVRSKAEKMIADYLRDAEIDFKYEPVLDVRGIRMRPDFFLSAYNLPYEHFGINNRAYLSQAERKIGIYYGAGDLRSSIKKIPLAGRKRRYCSFIGILMVIEDTKRRVVSVL